MLSFLHTSRSSTASLSSVRFIPDIVCISSIHFFLGRPLFLFPSPNASIIFFSIPFARIPWPKNIIFCFAALYPSDKTPLPCGSLSDLHQYRLVDSLLCPRDP